MKKKITPSTLASESVSNPTAMPLAARGSIKVMKTSYFTPSVIGAGYGVYTDKACTQAVGALWIGTVGKNYDVASNLPLGTYYVKEFYAPEGYELDEEVYMVKLTQNGQMAVVNSVEPTTEPHGNIRVVKSTYFNDPVVGTGFGIYNNKDCTLEHNVDTLWIGLKGDDSDISIDLPLGTYYVKEYYTLADNYADDEIHTVTLANDGDMVTVTSIAPTKKRSWKCQGCKEIKLICPRNWRRIRNIQR